MEDFIVRDFLNLNDNCEGAIINGRVTRTGYYIKITDCNRMINLHARFGDESDKKNAIHKLDTIINTLSKMKAEVENRYEILKKDNERKKALAKRKKELALEKKQKTKTKVNDL